MPTLTPDQQVLYQIGYDARRDVFFVFNTHTLEMMECNGLHGPRPILSALVAEHGFYLRPKKGKS